MHTFFRTIRPLEAKRFGIDVYEDTFHYQPSLGDLVAPATLRGFFQSEKYFDSVASEIKSILWESQAAFDAIKMSQDLEIPQGFIAVNVRLGDYLKVSDYFVNLPPRYFELAIALAKRRREKSPSWCSPTASSFAKDWSLGRIYTLVSKKGIRPFPKCF